jgi:biopolymer transport protein TolR
VKTKRTKRKLVAEINVVPYIDVTLVLLVVFMITAPLLMQGVKVDLPEANSAPMDTKDQEPFIVSIKADGSYWIDVKGENQIQSLDVIKDRVGKILRQTRRGSQSDERATGCRSALSRFGHGATTELIWAVFSVTQLPVWSVSHCT